MWKTKQKKIFFQNQRIYFVTNYLSYFINLFFLQATTLFWAIKCLASFWWCLLIHTDRTLNRREKKELGFHSPFLQILTLWVYLVRENVLQFAKAGGTVELSSRGLLSEWRRRRSPHLVCVYQGAGQNLTHHSVLSSRLEHSFHSLSVTMRRARVRKTRHWQPSKH